MKKIGVSILVFLFVMCGQAAAFAGTALSYTGVGKSTDVGIMSSQYIASYDAWIEKEGDGEIMINAVLFTMRASAAKITADLQYLDNGVWKTLKTYTKYDSQGDAMMGEFYNGKVGGYYRVKCQYDALVSGSVVETRSYTSYIVQAN